MEPRWFPMGVFLLISVGTAVDTVWLDGKTKRLSKDYIKAMDMEDN